MAKQNTAPTMKDVAKEAGVSLGTVSKVINGIPVGEEYRKKVEQAIKELDYHLNAYARGLKSNRTNTIAVILPTIAHPYFGLIAHCINSRCKSAATGCCSAIPTMTMKKSRK